MVIKKKKVGLLKIKNSFFQRRPLICPPGVSSLERALGSWVSGVQAKTGSVPGGDPPSRLQRALCSREAGAGPRPVGPWTRSSPHRGLWFITHEKRTTRLQMQTRGAKGTVLARPASCQSSLPGGARGRRAPRSRLRPGRSNSCSAASLSFIFLSRVRTFFAFFWSF